MLNQVVLISLIFLLTLAHSIYFVFVQDKFLKVISLIGAISGIVVLIMVILLLIRNKEA